MKGIRVPARWYNSMQWVSVEVSRDVEEKGKTGSYAVQIKSWTRAKASGAKSWNEQ